MELTYGPLNKSIFTQQLELINKCLFYFPHQIDLRFDDHHSLHIQIAHMDFDLSALFKKANFSHIQLNEKDSKRYLKKSFLHPMHELTDAEQFAVMEYTADKYVAINSLLYGKVSAPLTVELKSALKDTISHVGLLASGLNKMDTITQEPTSYRGESHLDYSEIMKRIQLIEAGGGITQEKGYLSTTIDYQISNDFKNRSLIIFDGSYGKDISALSCFPEEEERLLPPSLVAWESYELKDGIYYFHAKVVAPLLEEPIQASDVIDFKQLYEWAQQQGLEGDFLTPYLQEILQSGLEEEALPTAPPFTTPFEEIYPTEIWL